MDASTRLGLPFMAAQQAQKFITFNEMVAALDLMVQLSVLSRAQATPPGAPDEGDAYIVAAAPTGDWTGQAGRIAVFRGGAWDFVVPGEGWLAYVLDTTELAVFSGGAWAPFVTNGGAAVAKLGINGTADLTNRLAVAADATLFSHDGDSHRLKINKALAGDTASVLFQTGFSGRAEFGLAGDDDFHVKVSADGATWTDALAIGRSSGLLTLPRGQIAFPAAQNPSSNANTLDDYEEGTWTPTVTAASGSITAYTASGSYVKVGRLVFVTGTIVFTNIGSAASLATVTLPFTPSAFGAGCGTNTDSGATLSVFVSTAGVLNINLYNNFTFPAASGQTLRFSACFMAGS